MNGRPGAYCFQLGLLFWHLTVYYKLFTTLITYSNTKMYKSTIELKTYDNSLLCLVEKKKKNNPFLAKIQPRSADLDRPNKILLNFFSQIVTNIYKDSIVYNQH